MVVKPEGKGPFGRLVCGWGDNNKMDIQEDECGGMDWIKLAQDREMWQTLLTAVMNLPVS
jgi:hypothetical protein